MRRTFPATRRARRALLTTVACGAALAGSAHALAAGIPTATTLPIDPALVADRYALLSGEVNPQGNDVVYRFQWGKTTAYGRSTPVTPAGNGTDPVPVSVSLDQTDGLKPRTTYHYRLVVSLVKPGGDLTYVGDVAGADQTFTTARRLGVRFATDRARVRRGVVKVKLKAVGPPGEAARGKLTLRAKLGRKTRKVGTARYAIAVGKGKRVKVELTARALEALDAGPLDVKAAAKTKGVKKPARHRLVLRG